MAFYWFLLYAMHFAIQMRILHVPFSEHSDLLCPAKVPGKSPVEPRNCTISNCSFTITPGGVYFDNKISSAFFWKSSFFLSLLRNDVIFIFNRFFPVLGSNVHKLCRDAISWYIIFPFCLHGKKSSEELPVVSDLPRAEYPFSFSA